MAGSCWSSFGITTSFHTSLCIYPTSIVCPLQAYLQQYVQYPMFRSADGKAQDLSEFEEAREVIAALSAEYAAFEQPGGELGALCHHSDCGNLAA